MADSPLIINSKAFALDAIRICKELRAAKLEADTLRGKRNSVSKSIGMLMAQKKIENRSKGWSFS